MQHIVSQPHLSTYPNPISFTKGDKLILGRRDDEYVGWIWTTVADGNAGWAPEQLIDIIAPDAGIARESYTAKELNTSVGETITLLQTLNEWGWVENANGEQGWVPLATLKVETK